MTTRGRARATRDNPIKPPQRNRVWIEIERPEFGDDAMGHKRAALMSNLLRRLAEDNGKESFGSQEPCWWNERKRCYCFTVSSAGSFVEGSDNGHWWSLDYLGRPLDEPVSGS